jgi:hypothetical protein
MKKYIIRGLLISLIIPVGILAVYFYQSFTAPNAELAGYSRFFGFLYAFFSLPLVIFFGVFGGMLYSSFKKDGNPSQK